MRQKPITLICENCNQPFTIQVWKTKTYGRRYCGLACRNAAYTAEKQRTLPERFWSKVDRGSDCWTWQGPRTSHGYGHHKVGGRRVFTHRTAWEITNGPIPEGLWVLHECDNPSCVNPTHLFLGTPKDNTQDMIRKGRDKLVGENHYSRRRPDRVPQGDRHWMRQRPDQVLRGTQCSWSKLTEDDVRTIRTRHANGITQTELAHIYGIDRMTIKAIITRRTWKHVT